MAAKQVLFACIAFILGCSGCSSAFEGIGENLGNGLGGSLATKADSITGRAVKGAADELTKPELARKLDTLITLLGQSTNRQLSGIRDTLIGRVTQQRLDSLREELVGEKTKNDLLAIRNSFFDRSLQQYLSKTLNQVGPSILNESTKTKLIEFRDTLLGATSNRLLKAIIDTAMTDLETRLKNEVYPEMRGNISFVERNATWLIILIGLVAVGVAWFIWAQKEKYVRMAKLLTYQISESKDTPAKEALKNSVSKNAKMIGIEDDLREFLDSQGLLHMKSPD